MSQVAISGNASGTGTLTIAAPNTNSNYTLTLPQATTTLVGTDATQTLTNKTIQGGAITSGTAVASTSGTSIDFTALPSWVKRITVMFSGVSLSGTAGLVVQIGSGSVTTSGYTSGGVTAIASGSSSGGYSVTTGWQLNDASTAASLYNGSIFLVNISSNTWMESGTIANTVGTRAAISGGNVSIGGTIDRVRITTSNGTDTFDAGSINIMYEG